jgi:hypothetical protein
MRFGGRFKPREGKHRNGKMPNGGTYDLGIEYCKMLGSRAFVSPLLPLTFPRPIPDTSRLYVRAENK